MATKELSARDWEQVIQLAQTNLAQAPQTIYASKQAPRWQVLDFVPKNNKARNWYKESRIAVKRAYGKDWKLFCALLAVTSPRQSIHGNITVATRAYNQIKSTGTIPRQGYWKSWYTGVIKYLETGRVTGMKTGNFYRNLIGDETVVTVDIWMMRYAGMTGKAPTKRQHADITEHIKQDAQEQGITPAQRQAEIWVHVRGAGESFGTLLSQLGMAI